MSSLVVMVIDENERAVARQPLPWRRREAAENGQRELAPERFAQVTAVAKLSDATQVRVLGRRYCLASQVYHLRPAIHGYAEAFYNSIKN